MSLELPYFLHLERSWHGFLPGRRKTESQTEGMSSAGQWALLLRDDWIMKVPNTQWMNLSVDRFILRWHNWEMVDTGKWSLMEDVGLRECPWRVGPLSSISPCLLAIVWWAAMLYYTLQSVMFPMMLCLITGPEQWRQAWAKMTESVIQNKSSFPCVFF